MKTFLLALALLALALHLGANAATTIKVDIRGSEAQVEKLSPIIPAVERIINSPEFRMEVLAHEYLHHKAFADTKDSNEKVYSTLLAKDWDLHYAFEFQRTITWHGFKCPVLGWTNPKTSVVYFNTCNFDGRDAAGLAGTVCHEQSHKLGYDHSSAKSLNSVPYAIGRICEELYHKYK